MANIIVKAAVRAVNTVLVGNGYAPILPAVGGSLTRLFRFIGWAPYTMGDWDSNKYISEGYMSNAMVYSIVKRIASTAAIAPMKVYRIKDKKKHLQIKTWTGERATEASIRKAMAFKELAYEEDLNHPLNKLIERPNKLQKANEFQETCVGFILLTGNRFVFLNVLEAGANQGKPYEIYNLPPGMMEILGGRTLFEVSGYQLNLGQIVEIPKEFIVHSKYPNYQFNTSGGHLWGMAPLKAGRRTVDRSNKAEARGVTILDNGGAAGVLFNKPGAGAIDKDNAWNSTDPVKKGLLKKAMNETINGSENAGTIAMANGDLGYIKFGLTAQELSIIDQEKYSDEKLCNIFNVPPGLFMASANATDNNIAAWNRQLISQAVVPELNKLRDDWNTIAERFGDDVYVDYDLSVYPELQEDQDKVAERLNKMWYLKGNEKRLQTGFDEDAEDPMMNKYLVPSGFKLLDDLNPDNLQDELDDFDNGGADEAAGNNSGDQVEDTEE